MEVIKTHLQEKCRQNPAQVRTWLAFTQLLCEWAPGRAVQEGVQVLHHCWRAEVRHVSRGGLQWNAPI